jgi:mono/diheme cytochrome c family protein
MRTVLVGVLTVIALATTGLVVVFFGLYDVAATTPQSAPARWILEEAMESSVKARAAEIEAPPLDDLEQLRLGHHEYEEMCVMCHAAPGVRASSLAKGLEPAPPELHEAEEAEEWSAAETFWIVKNGIRMTGMPAFGPTHDDETIWAIVAFLRKLPHLSPQDYATFAGAEVGDTGEHHGDDHGHHADDGDEHDDHGDAYGS